MVIAPLFVGSSHQTLRTSPANNAQVQERGRGGGVPRHSAPTSGWRSSDSKLHASYTNPRIPRNNYCTAGQARWLEGVIARGRQPSFLPRSSRWRKKEEGSRRAKVVEGASSKIIVLTGFSFSRGFSLGKRFEIRCWFWALEIDPAIIPGELKSTRIGYYR